MTNELHQDIKQILQDTAQIKAALWPDPNQPGVLTEHGKRITALEGWRNILNGIWITITTIASIVFSIHVRGEK